MIYSVHILVLKVKTTTYYRHFGQNNARANFFHNGWHGQLWLEQRDFYPFLVYPQRKRIAFAVGVLDVDDKYLYVYDVLGRPNGCLWNVY